MAQLPISSVGTLIIYTPAALKLNQLKKQERKAAFPGKWSELMVPSLCESPSGDEWLDLFFLKGST